MCCIRGICILAPGANMRANMIFHPVSVLALKWLSSTSEQNNINIQHARNSDEKRVGNYRLDGFHEETNNAYEVHGCFWHWVYEMLFKGYCQYC